MSPAQYKVMLRVTSRSHAGS